MSDSQRLRPELVEIALDHAEGFAFERFAIDFIAALEGIKFTPLGGVHDGGADGFAREEIHESSRAGSFYQFTVQKDHRSKIRKTIARLKEFGRVPRVLYYVSAQNVLHSDVEEDDLSTELGVIVRIRDRSYIVSHINSSAGTASAYIHHLSTYTEYLSRVGGRDDKGVSRYVTDPSVFVFLQHEVANRMGDRKLVHSITDTLILWALRDTDPDKKVFKNKGEIFAEILNEFPWAKHFLSAHIDQRLEELRLKKVGGREVRWYKKEDKYCLPHETRECIKDENVGDEALKIRFVESLRLKAVSIPEAESLDCSKISELCAAVVVMVFERQGLMLSTYVIGGEESGPLVVSDCIESVLDQSKVAASEFPAYRVVLEKIISSVLYNSSPEQREYLQHLARTYVLLFTLKAEPRIIEYFGAMGAQFNLFVGSDILVRALSERYLSEEDQSGKLLMRAAKACGMSLKLSECVLDEVYVHIRNTNSEFINHFADIEPYVTRELARNSDKILIRSYFYAKESGHVHRWKSFIEQFISYSNIYSKAGRDELKRYLISEYSLVFVENEDLESVVDSKKVDELASALLDNDDKDHEQLAHNSALLVHGIYGLRRKGAEQNSGSPFGYKTWWLTNQTRIQKHTADLVKKNFAKYIMRPEFVLNFMALAPSCEQARGAYGRLLPTTLGIQLGHRLRDDVLHNVLGKVKEWKEYEPGRVNALVAQLSDKLKTDQYKVYDVTMESLGKI